MKIQRISRELLFLLRILSILGIISTIGCTHNILPTATKVGESQATLPATVIVASSPIPSATHPGSTQDLIADRITITYATYLQDDQLPTLQPLVDEFEKKYPNINMRLLSIYS